MKPKEMVELPNWDDADLADQVIPYSIWTGRDGPKWNRFRVRDVSHGETWLERLTRNVLKNRHSENDANFREYGLTLQREVSSINQAAITVGRYLYACANDKRVQNSPQVLALVEHVRQTLASLPPFADKLPLATKEGLAIEQANNRKAAAIRAATHRHAKDPRRTEKGHVFACWKLWKERPSRYKSKAAFARDMLEKFDSLKSPRVIEDWCREWESAAK